MTIVSFKNKEEEESRLIFGEEIFTDERTGVEGEIPSGASVNKDNSPTDQPTSGTLHSIEKQSEYTDLSPEISAEDIDAYWEGGDTAGEETSLGSNPTPDQDIVDDIGRPWGLDYQSGEEINVGNSRDKLEKARREDEEKGLREE